jgi:TPR repeat protein
MMNVSEIKFLEFNLKQAKKFGNEELSLWYQCLIHLEKLEYDQVISVAEKLVSKYNTIQYKGFLASFYMEYTKDKTLWLKSIRLFEELVEDGDKVAGYMLGSIYEEGKGVPEDKQKAYQYYMKSVSQYNLAEALIALGWYHEHGWVVNKDADKALEYYEKAIQLGQISAIEYIVNIYISLEEYQLASEWAMKGFEIGDLQSIAILGSLYEGGIGVKKNLKKAAELFKLAADQGNSTAQYLYSKALSEGKGVRKNIIKAYDYLCKSVVNGNPIAMEEYHKMQTNFFDSIEAGINRLTKIT